MRCVSQDVHVYGRGPLWCEFFLDAAQKSQFHHLIGTLALNEESVLRAFQGRWGAISCGEQSIAAVGGAIGRRNMPTGPRAMATALMLQAGHRHRSIGQVRHHRKRNP
jgi:hypothetical protein